MYMLGMSSGCHDPGKYQLMAVGLSDRYGTDVRLPQTLMMDVCSGVPQLANLD